MYGPTAPLSKELQQHPWPQNYKPRIPLFDGMTNPGNFIASYETTDYSARGDIQTLVISLILAVKGVAHDWYMSLKPLSVHSWHQIKAELLATFQGYRLEMKTTRDLMNCVQQDDEALSNYLKRFILLKGMH
jgi:hypothetical protein